MLHFPSSVLLEIAFWGSNEAGSGFGGGVAPELGSGFGGGDASAFIVLLLY